METVAGSIVLAGKITQSVPRGFLSTQHYFGLHSPYGQAPANTLKVEKCSLCSHRLERTKEPACVTVCPVNSRIYGEREELLREANKRMAELRAKGMRVHLEGVDKDQTAVMYLVVNLES